MGRMLCRCGTTLRTLDVVLRSDNTTKRRRECPACGQRCTTSEKVESWDERPMVEREQDEPLKLRAVVG